MSKVDAAIGTLRDKIGQVDQHHASKAIKAAEKLLLALESARNEYEIDLKNPHTDIENAGKQFKQKCETAINKAKPILEKDLGWGDYLKNLLKTLVNAVIWTVTFGNVNTFFPYARSASIQAVEQAEQDLIQKPGASLK
ncbi:hypothetical protein [Legionella norrlandica]|nr:hypothetical protein [Legionella norrlandica]